jgi:DNA-binding LacI/PurR family transcriptional regulator
VEPPARSAPTPAATLDAVAAQAGVSRATASRVLTGSPKVSEQARAAVLAAADALAYVANPAARSLAKRRSDSVAFVVVESEERLFTDPFFAAALRGVQGVLVERELQLLFVVIGNERDAERFLRFAGQGHIDGAILLSVHGQDPLPARLRERGVRVVLSGRPYTALEDQPFVDADNADGGRQAAELLLSRGCRRVATIHGPLDMAASQDRLEGFTQRLAEAGVERSEVCVVGGDFSMLGGAAAMTEVLQRSPQVDGVFAANDLMAVGAMQALTDAGRSIPGDVAVIGFDDVPIGLGARPALTTVRQPIEAMGRAMADLLVRAVEGHQDGPTQVILPTTLVRRDSA